jgi:hypothetical protein
MPTAPAASYWALSRAPRYSLTFALPLLLAYEGLAALLGGGAGGVRNGADVWIKAPFVFLLGPQGALVFGLLAVGLAVALIARDARATRAPLRGDVFAGMLAESTAMAVVCGLTVGLATAHLLRSLPGLAVAAQAVTSLGWPTKLMIALGAGLYEELLFRVHLVSALAYAARRGLGWGPRGAGVLAAGVSALAFSAFHYVGAYGDPFTIQSFTFRALAGLAFSALYLVRGFGITAWTHALYDVGFFLF